MSLHPNTRQYIESHARLCNIDMGKIGIDACLNECPHREIKYLGSDKEVCASCGVEPILATYCIRQESHEGDCHFNSLVDLDVYEFVVVYGGAVDEEFYAVTMYEVNLADWLAESCRDEVEATDLDEFPPSWSVEVYCFPKIEGDPPKYRVTSDDPA